MTSAITRFAKDKDCQVRVIGICCFDSTKSIWSHARWEHAGKGKSIKAPDVCGAIACTPCDAAYDQGQGVRQAGLTRDQVDRDWLDGHMRSLVMLVKAGAGVSAEHIALQTFRLLTDDLEPIGQGISRKVYSMPYMLDLVLKIEEAGKSFSNAHEWATWQFVKGGPYERWFAPCVAISPDSTAMLQKRTTKPRQSQLPKSMPVFLGDFKVDNYGMLNNRLVAHDYGLFAGSASGFSKRMNNVRWWHFINGESFYLDGKKREID